MEEKSDVVKVSNSISSSYRLYSISNQVSRDVQNWTGANGVLDIVSAGKVMYRFIEVDKVSTARGTGKSGSGQSRPYRFGWGVLDRNMNYRKDPEEKYISK